MNILTSGIKTLPPKPSKEPENKLFLTLFPLWGVGLRGDLHLSSWKITPAYRRWIRHFQDVDTERKSSSIRKESQPRTFWRHTGSKRSHLRCWLSPPLLCYCLTCCSPATSPPTPPLAFTSLPMRGRARSWPLCKYQAALEEKGQNKGENRGEERKEGKRNK